MFSFFAFMVVRSRIEQHDHVIFRNKVLDLVIHIWKSFF